MENFSKKTFLQKLLQKSLLLMVLFLGGCELAPYPKEYLQYILGSGTGVKVYADNPTMYFKINDEATSVTLYTTTSTTTLAYTDGDYNWGAYEGANFKLQLFDIHSKGGTFKLYSNNSLTDEDDFIWWFGAVDLNPALDPVLQLLADKTILADVVIMQSISHSVISKDASEMYVYTTSDDVPPITFTLKEYDEDYVCYYNDDMMVSGKLDNINKDGGDMSLSSYPPSVPFIYAEHTLALAGKTIVTSSGVSGTFSADASTLTLSDLSITLDRVSSTSYVAIYDGDVCYTFYFPTENGGTFYYKSGSGIDEYEDSGTFTYGGTTKTFIEYFVDEEPYDDYIYYSSSTSLKHKSTGKMYRYTGDGKVVSYGKMEGTFKNADTGAVLIATVDTTTGEITIRAKTFLDYFENGETYGDNKEYSYNNQKLTKDGVDYTYKNDCVDNGDGTLTGTFWNTTTAGSGNYLEVIVTTATETITIYERFIPTDWYDASAAAGYVTFNATATEVSVGYSDVDSQKIYAYSHYDGTDYVYKNKANADDVISLYYDDAIMMGYTTSSTTYNLLFDADIVSQLSAIVPGKKGVDDKDDNLTLVFSEKLEKTANTLTYNTKTYRHNRSFYDTDYNKLGGTYMYEFEVLDLSDITSTGGKYTISGTDERSFSFPLPPSDWYTQIAAGGHICFGMDATTAIVDYDGTGGAPFSYNEFVIDSGVYKYKYKNGDNVVYFWENDNDNTSMYAQYNTEAVKLVYFDTDMVSQLSDIVAGVTGTEPVSCRTLVFSSLKIKNGNTITYNGKIYKHNRSYYDATTDKSSGTYMYGFEELNIYDVASEGGIHSSWNAFYFPATAFSYEGATYKYIANARGDVLYDNTLLPMTTASGYTYYWNRANNNNVYFKTANGFTGLQGVTSTKDGYATRVLVDGKYFHELNPTKDNCFDDDIDGDIFIDGNVNYLWFDSSVKGNVYLNGNADYFEIHYASGVDYVYINGDVTDELLLLNNFSGKPYATGTVNRNMMPVGVKLYQNAGATVNSAINTYISENVEKILTGLGIDDTDFSKVTTQ